LKDLNISICIVTKGDYSLANIITKKHLLCTKSNKTKSLDNEFEYYNLSIEDKTQDSIIRFSISGDELYKDWKP